MTQKEKDLQKEIIQKNIRIKALTDQVNDMTLNSIKMCEKAIKLGKLFGINEEELLKVWQLL